MRPGASCALVFLLVGFELWRWGGGNVSLGLVSCMPTAGAGLSAPAVYAADDGLDIIAIPHDAPMEDATADADRAMVC